MLVIPSKIPHNQASKMQNTNAKSDGPTQPMVMPVTPLEEGVEDGNSLLLEWPAKIIFWIFES